MGNKKWEFLAFIIILTFSLTLFAVHTAYSQVDDYIASYFSTYHSTWPFGPYGIQTPIYSYSSLYAGAPDDPQARRRAINDFNIFYTQADMFEAQSIHYGGMIYGNNILVDGVQNGGLSRGIDYLITDAIFNQISGNYQSTGNPMGLFNQLYTHIPGVSGYQSPKLSIQKCLQERPDLDTTRCIMFHRNPSLSVYSGNSPGYMGDKMGSPFKLSAIPSTDYLSLYFLCFEGSE